jgi:hypothetical protein
MISRVCHYHKEHSFLSAMERVSNQLARDVIQ